MNYLKIDKCNMLNGSGIRVVLWVSGCSHKCLGCQNEFTWDENAGVPFTENDKNELFEALKEDYIEGLTLSGGDPLYCNNRNAVLELLKEVKEKFPEKNVWLYTGYTEDACGHSKGIMQILKYVDTLVEGPFVQELLSPGKEWVGSSNQSVIQIEK